MANKNFTLDSGLAVTIYKRRQSRNLRLSITPHGQVRVTIPAWAPYRAGLEFAKSRQSWIAAQHKPAALLAQGQPIGKAHRLVFEPGDYAKPSSRLSSTSIIVRYPAEMPSESAEVQQAAHTVCVRALRQEAEHLLPQKLAVLAAAHGFAYNRVSIKRLKGRWGSCDHQQNIVLNLFLMQLPWDLIDYVLLHELVHTRVLRHGPDFWQAMAAAMPPVKERRKALREYSPVLASPRPEQLMA